MKADFSRLEAHSGAISTASVPAAANSFADAAVPFSEKWRVEVGANVVSRSSSYGIADVTLGSRDGVTVPRNSLGILAEVHTHTQGSEGFSGPIIYSPATGERQYNGDTRTFLNDGIDGFVYRIPPAGGGAWKFDHQLFQQALDDAKKNGIGIDSRVGPYVERIR